MSNYRRLISYIYVYEGGVKGKNIGFAKIEIRNGQCKIQVNVKRVFLGNSDIGVYLLAPQKEILLGRIFIRNGAGEFRVNVNAGDVDNHGCSMDQCYGLTIHETDSSWRTYTTIWEDAVAQAAEVDLAEVTSEKVKETAESEIYSSVAMEIQKELEQENKNVLEDEAAQENGREDEAAQRNGQEDRAAQENGQEDETAQEKGKLEITEVSETEPARAEVDETEQSGKPGNPENGDESGKEEEGQVRENQEMRPEPEENSRKDAERTGQTKEEGSVMSLQEYREEKEESSNGEETQGNTGRQGWDSVSEKVLKIAKAFVQGRESWAGQENISSQNISSKKNPKHHTEPEKQEVSINHTGLAKQAVSPDPKSASQSMSGNRRAPVQRAAASQLPEPGDPARLAELDLQEQEEMEKGNLWVQLQRRYPKVLAFDYVNGCEILSVKPQDIGILPRENWIYGNNSFLLHGYYNYRHLILARLENPEGEPRYLLGVPGHYYSNEKNLAAMFGFANFVLAKKQPEQDGRFGYWYTDLRL